jgi:hypothetical protein
METATRATPKQKYHKVLWSSFDNGVSLDLDTYGLLKNQVETVSCIPTKYDIFRKPC